MRRTWLRNRNSAFRTPNRRLNFKNSSVPRFRYNNDRNIGILEKSHLLFSKTPERKFMRNPRFGM